MKKYKKLQIESGRRFGMLIVISEVEPARLPSGQTNRRMLCMCDCGREKIVRVVHLTRLKTISCGCMSGEKHPLGRGKLYSAWRQMIERCHKPYTQERNKRRYQDKGITVCDEWRKSFNSFQLWSLSNGYTEGLQIDRIDNSKGYSPGNCRFTTHQVNVNNRDITIMIEINGQKVSASAILSGLNLSQCSKWRIVRRLKRGWPLDEAINTPSLTNGYKKKRFNK